MVFLRRILFYWRSHSGNAAFCPRSVSVLLLSQPHCLRPQSVIQSEFPPTTRHSWSNPVHIQGNEPLPGSIWFVLSVGWLPPCPLVFAQKGLRVGIAVCWFGFKGRRFTVYVHCFQLTHFFVWIKHKLTSLIVSQSFMTIVHFRFQMFLISSVKFHSMLLRIGFWVHFHAVNLLFCLIIGLLH